MLLLLLLLLLEMTPNGFHFTPSTQTSPPECDTQHPARSKVQPENNKQKMKMNNLQIASQWLLCDLISKLS